MRVSFSQRQPLAMSRSPSNSVSHQHSSPHLHAHAHKLEQQIKQFSKQAKHNKSVLADLECRRKFFKKICDKQREKLASVDVKLIKEEYEAQLRQLRSQKERLQQMVDQIHENFQQNSSSNLQIRCSLAQNRSFMQRSLAQLKQESKLYRQLLQKKLETMQNQKSLILQNQQLISQKEMAEEQYGSVCEQLRRWEHQI